MQLIAHRGGAGLRVENTLAAFEHAIALGAHGAELDVHLTRDGQAVVHHDPVLNPGYCRRAGGDWIGDDEVIPIAQSTLADLQCYEVGVPKPGSDYAARFDRITPMPSQHVPLLRDVIRLVKARSPRFKLVIEIKASYLDAGKERWRPLVDAVLDIVARERFFDRTILCSFDWGALLYARRFKPRLVTWFTSSPLSWFGEERPAAEDMPPEARYLEAVRTLYGGGNAPWFAGFDPRRFKAGYPEAIAAAGGNAWLLYYRDCTDQVVRELASRGLESAAWSVNLQDKDQLARLVHIGVDNLLVDYPDLRLESSASIA
jgi:glycerophosphoryl diester phosphodiesterase